MAEIEKYQEIIDKLQKAQYCTEGLSELFCNLKGGDDFHITEGGLYGVSLILENIKEEIRLSQESLDTIKFEKLKI